MSSNPDALERRTRQLTEGSLLKALLRLAVPVILSITLQALWWSFPAANLLALLVTLVWFRRSVWTSRVATRQRQGQSLPRE